MLRVIRAPLLDIIVAEILGKELEQLADEIIAGKRRKRKAKPRRTLARDVLKVARALANRGTKHG